MMKVWTALLVLGAAASVAAWAIALCHENGVCPFAATARFVRSLPWGGRLAVVPLFAALIVYGSVKQGESGGVGELGGNHGIDGTGTNISSNRAERVDRVDGITECGNGLDRIDKIDGIGDVESPQISTNLHKSICVDGCGFVDCNLGEQLQKALHVSACSTRLENSLRSSVKMLPVTNFNPQLETGERWDEICKFVYRICN